MQDARLSTLHLKPEGLGCGQRNQHGTALEEYSLRSHKHAAGLIEFCIVKPH